MLSIRMRPWTVFLFIREITESVPSEFTMGNRTSKSNFLVCYVNNFPVSMAGAIFNIDFLPYLKRIGSKCDDGVIVAVHERSFLTRNPG